MPIAGDAHWSLDKRIPVAVILALIGNIVAGVIFATQMHSMILDHERRVERLEAKDRADDARNQQLNDAVIRLQEATVTLREAVVELRQTYRPRQ